MILYIRGTSAGVVQRLVRGLAKAETWVRFPSLAPNEFYTINLVLFFMYLKFEPTSLALVRVILKTDNIFSKKIPSNCD